MILKGSIPMARYIDPIFIFGRFPTVLVEDQRFDVELVIEMLGDIESWGS